MSFTKNRIFAVVAAIAGMTSAFATTLTFEGTGTNVNLPADWASNAAADGTGWNVANGATLNVALTWSHVGGTSPGWQFYNDSEWTGAQLNDFYATDRKFDLLFTPDAGFRVKLSSFVFDDYADYDAGNDFAWEVRAGSASGSILAGGTATTMDGQNLLVESGLGYVEGPILLRISANSQPAGSGGFDQAIDDIVFMQEPVPEPASMTALGLGIAALLRRRKK